VHAAHAEATLHAVQLATHAVLATATRAVTKEGVEVATERRAALEAAVSAAAEELAGPLLAAWQPQANTRIVLLVVKNLAKAQQLRDLAKAVRRHAGVLDVRQRSFRGRAAELEIEGQSSARELVEMLRADTYPDFKLEVAEAGGDRITAAVK
jgi:hypothetical protein